MAKNQQRKNYVIKIKQIYRANQLKNIDIKSNRFKLKLTMDQQLRQKATYHHDRNESVQDYDSFRIHTTKKPLIRQNDLQTEPASMTDRIYNQTEHSRATVYQISQPQQQQIYELTDRTNTYTTGASEYQFLIYENKIHLLTDRLQCYMDEVQNLKKTNSILISKLSTIEALDEQLQNQKLKNLQLREQIQTYRDKLDQQKDDYDTKVDQLKLQLEEKDHFIQLMRNQNSKIAKKKDQQIALFRQTLKQKTALIDSYEKQLHHLQIERLNTSDDFSSRDSLFTRNSAISQYNVRNYQHSNTLHQSTVSVEEKARQFVKKNQTQLKIAMKSISHAQKCLEIGGQQISTIMGDKQNEKSSMNISTFSKSKINKTYCK